MTAQENLDAGAGQELPNPDTGAQPEPTLRDTIRGALENATKPPVDGSIAEAGQQRDDQGRFVPRQTEGVKRDTLSLPGKRAVPPAAQPGTAAGQPADAIKPPDGWTAAAKAKFSGLDPDIQAEVLRREKEAHQKITSQDSDRDFGQKIRRAAEPYSAIIAAEGGTHEAAFKDYLNYAYILRAGTPQQKFQALQVIAQRFNVPLGPLQPGQPQHSSANLLTPEQARLIAQEEIQRQRWDWEQSSLQGEIEAFANEAGHDHFETVKPIMAALLESGKAETLKDAYDQAIWALPDIRSTLTAQQLSDAEAKRLADSKQRTDAAKRAAVSVTGGPGGVKPPANGAGDRSLRDEIKANLAAATGRV